MANRTEKRKQKQSQPRSMAGRMDGLDWIAGQAGLRRFASFSHCCPGPSIHQTDEIAALIATVDSDSDWTSNEYSNLLQLVFTFIVLASESIGR